MVKLTESKARLPPRFVLEANRTALGPRPSPAEKKELGILEAKPQSIYIPPHKRSIESPKPSNAEEKQPSDKSFADTLIISDGFVEERWIECEERGIFAVWDGPSKCIPHLKWKIEKYC